MLRAVTDDETMDFTHLLGSIIFNAGTRARIGLTCSSFATFLGSMCVPLSRLVDMFFDSRYVHLGQEVSPQWAARIAGDIKRAMVEHRP